MLFYRTPKGVTLTENGKIFFEFIKNGVESFLNGEHKLTALNTLETGCLRIGASTTVTKYFLLPFIEKFHKKYPKIEISIINHLTSTMISLLKKGSLDLLIINLPTKTDNTLNVIPCAELHDCFAGNVEYKNQINHPIPLKDLVANFPIITQKEPSNTRTFLNSIMETNQIAFHPQFEVVSYGLVKEFGKIGMGISYITKEFAKSELKSKNLYPIPIIEKIPTRHLRFSNP